MFNLARRKKAKERSDNVVSSDHLLEMEILEVKTRLQDAISPAETYIMMTQSILVWENPKYTSVTFVFANILFWLATTMPIYRLIGLTGLVLVFADMWTTKIWPEIRVAPGDDEGWTPLYPRLLSVPELCHYGAANWVSVRHRVKWLNHFRRNHHARFFFLMVIVLGCGALLGTYISGMMLIYILVMCCLLLPGVAYHHLIQNALAHMQPFIHQTETYFNVKRKKRTRKVKKKGGAESLETSQADLDSDSDEYLPEEFLPTFDSPESGIPGISRPEIEGVTPALSQVSTDLDLSDDEIAMMPTTSMPAFDDSHLDESYSDIEQMDGHLEVPDVDMQASDSDLDTTLLKDGDEGYLEDNDSESDPSPSQSQKDMLFKESHFKNTSSDSDVSDEANLLQGLAIPDVNDESVSENPEGFIGHFTHQMAAAVTAETVSQNLSSLVSSTMYGLSRIQETVRGAVQATGGAADKPQQQPDDKGDMTDSLDPDILAEFDFLDDEDMGSDEEVMGAKSGDKESEKS